MVTSPSVTASSTDSPHVEHEYDAPSVQLSATQAIHYRKLAREIVARTLEQETQFRYRDNATLDERDWKFVRRKDRMRVYKRTPAAASLSATSVGLSGDSMLPMVLAVGSIEGTLEDALYGMHHKTTREMLAVTSFLNKSHLDAAVLATLEVGSDADPFRYLGLKWRVVQTPGPDTLIQNRDVLTLEHAGIRIDARGHKYGFHLLKSVDHPDASELAGATQRAEPTARNAVRAQAMICFIYRQLTPTRVGAYCKGIFTLGGNVLDCVSFFTAAEMVLGIAKALECAAAKRLTLLALQRRDVVTPLLLRSSNRMSKDKLELTSSESTSKSSTSSNSIVCSVCCKKRFFLGPMLRTCKLCARAACAKCVVKAPLFATPRNLRVLCCKACVLVSRTLEVDPRDPLPVLVLDDDEP